MAKLKFYIMGFMAWLPFELVPEEVRLKDRPPGAYMNHHVGMTLAFSDEEARAQGIEMAKRAWPESEGWFDHYASVDAMPTDKAAELLRLIDAGEFNREHEPLGSHFVRGEEIEERAM